METKKYRFDEVTINFDKKRIPLSSAQREKRQGTFRYYGAQGVIDHVDDYIFDGTYLLIAEDGENLKSKKQNIAQVVDGQFWVNNHAHIVQGNEQCDTRFLCYLINSMDLSGYVTGSAQPKLSQANLNAVTLSLPTLAEQKRIVEYLYMLDQKIDVNRQINDNLEQQAQSYFQELFVDNADPEWAIGTISDLGTVVGGSTPSKAKPEYYTESGIAWITPKDLSINKSKFVSHGENDITELGLKNSSAAIMPEGTVLFSSRAPIGYIAIAAGEVTTNQGFKSVVPKPEIGTPFVYFFLKNTLPVIEGMASGSTFKEVSGSTMKNVPAVIPDAETLAKFSDFCAPIFAQQRILEEQNQSLATLRDNLLPKLMSGEIDVSAVQL
jgi:type I restriction enzyme S subunit